MRTTYTRAPLVLTLLVAFACGKREREVPPPIGPTVVVSLDGAASHTVTVTGPTALETLVTPAPSTWLEVVAATADDRTLELAHPTTSYPGATLRLYLDQGSAALGVFRPLAPDLPRDLANIAKQPLQSLRGVTEIDVRTRAVALPPLFVVLDGTRTSVTDQLAQLSKSGATPRERGWRLGDVIALAVPAGTSVQAVRLVASGATTTLGREALDGVLKLSRHGDYVFRMWDNNPRDAPIRDVRGVTAIEVDAAR